MEGMQVCQWLVHLTGMRNDESQLLALGSFNYRSIIGFSNKNRRKLFCPHQTHLQKFTLNHEQLYFLDMLHVTLSIRGKIASGYTCESKSLFFMMFHTICSIFELIHSANWAEMSVFQDFLVLSSYLLYSYFPRIAYQFTSHHYSPDLVVKPVLGVPKFNTHSPTSTKWC